jgi:uncharacterized membrane protein YfbV (UPF0208 family)
MTSADNSDEKNLPKSRKWASHLMFVLALAAIAATWFLAPEHLITVATIAFALSILADWLILGRLARTKSTPPAPSGREDE